MAMRSEPALPRTQARPLILLGLLAAVLAIVPWARSRISASRQAESSINQGALALEQGRAGDAEAAWQEALRLSPRNATALRGLGTLYLSQRRLADARNVLNRLADISPSEPHVLCELAQAELEAGSTALLESAAQDGARAAAVEPDCVRAQTVAGNAWLTRGDSLRALRYLRRAVRLNPADVPLSLHFAALLLESRQLEEASRLALDLIRRYPGLGEGYLLLAGCYEAYPPGSPQSAAARPLLDRVLALDPTNARAHARRGHLELAAHQPGPALRDLEAALYLEPARTTVLFDLARSYRLAGRTSEAERTEREFHRLSTLESQAASLERRLLLRPGDAELFQQLTAVANALGNPERAARARRRAGDLVPASGVGP